MHLFKNQMSPNDFYYQEIHARSVTMTRSRSMTIYRIENLGSCCWEIYSGLHFSGDMEKISKKFDGAPSIKTPTTARVVDC